MIKSLRIINFQSHRDAELKFSPGVNAIVGDPQSGKTAILRAINLVRSNRPSGFRFHSNFAEGPATMVRIEVEDGSVAISKTDAGASYSIGTDDGHVKEFPKVGVSVPDVATEIMNLQDMNVQSQLDSHFLVGDNPADIAREINRVTKIDLVDKWTTELNRKKHGHSALIQQAKRKATELEEKIAGLEGIEQAGEWLKEGEAISGKADRIKTEWNSLRVLIDQIEDTDLNIAYLEKILPATPLLDKVEEIRDEIISTLYSLTILEQFLQLSGDVESMERIVGMASDFLDKISVKTDSQKEKQSGICSLQDFEYLNNEVELMETEIAGIKEKYMGMISEAGICPFCFTELTENSLGHVMDHL